MSNDTESLRTTLLGELKSANKMLQKYEDKMLEATGEPDEKIVEGVNYYRTAAQQLRAQLFETKTSLS